MPRWEAPIRALEEALRSPGPMRSWLRSRRWCGEAVGPETDIAVKDRALLWEADAEAVVLLLATAKEDQVTVPLHLPFSLSASRPSPDAFELAVGADRLYVVEAERQEPYARFLADGFRRQATLRTEGGDTLHFTGTSLGAFRTLGPAMDTDSSNLLLPFHTERGEIVFKSYKLLDVHNREPDIFARLHEKGFRDIPPYVGELSLGRGNDRAVLGIATEYVETEDLFTWFTDQWRAELIGGGASIPEFERVSLGLAASLGEATADLHEALFDRRPGPFQAETFATEDVDAAIRTALGYLTDALVRLAALARDRNRTVAVRAAAARGMAFENRERIEEVLRGLAATVGTPKCVIHADLHLGQVLRRAGDGGLLFVDFEGEPERTPGQRHVKLPPLRDVATMNRSFGYVAHYAWREFIRGDASAALRLLTRDSFSPEEAAIADRLLAWERAAAERFGQGYLARSTLYRGMDPTDSRRAIRGWMTEKALYELRYELKHRPENIFIPLEGVLSLASGGLD